MIVDENIEIGNNHMRYNDEVLKISNISRIWVFRFRNREKIAFEKEKKLYETAKERYILDETYRKNERKKKYTIAAVIAFIVAIFFFSIVFRIGLLFLIIAGVLCFIAYQIGQNDIIYNYSPPQERVFDDKYGLGIEMNSGYSVIFTAIANEGLQALRRLQEKLCNADLQKEITIFNMNENHISVENNEGIINTGDGVSNNIEEKEALKIWM